MLTSPFWKTAFILASQSLCFQGFMLTLRQLHLLVLALSQSLCFQGFMLTK